jgi:hypothetical protein
MHPLYPRRQQRPRPFYPMKAKVRKKQSGDLWPSRDSKATKSVTYLRTDPRTAFSSHLSRIEILRWGSGMFPSREYFQSPAAPEPCYAQVV